MLSIWLINKTCSNPFLDSSYIGVGIRESYCFLLAILVKAPAIHDLFSWHSLILNLSNLLQWFCVAFFVNWKQVMIYVFIVMHSKLSFFSISNEQTIKFIKNSFMWRNDIHILNAIHFIIFSSIYFGWIFLNFSLFQIECLASESQVKWKCWICWNTIYFIFFLLQKRIKLPKQEDSFTIKSTQT